MAAVDDMLAKRVQELAIEAGKPPSRYVRRDLHEISIDAALSSSVPIIDLHRLSSSSSSDKEKEEEMDKLRSSLSSWGLFQVIGHGIPSSLINEMRKAAKGFFDLPMKEKQRYSTLGDGELDLLDAYGSDHVVSEDQVLDWSDRLYLLVQPQHQREPKLWPEKPTTFRKVLDEYSMKSSLVAKELLKAMAKCLGLEENYFVKQFGDKAPTYARINYYPPCSRPDLVYGIKPHADGDAFTIVLQDKNVEGLQVLKEDQWIKVPIIPHALLVNIGDQMEIMSNGLFKSPVHRVVTNTNKERISLAMFYAPEVEKEIEPADELIDESKPRLFRKVKVKDYAENFVPKYLQGKRAIDWAKIV